MINAIFDWCVQFLLWLGDGIGIGYKAINVWIFVIIWPVFTLGLVALVFVQWRALRRLRSQAGEVQTA